MNLNKLTRSKIRLLLLVILPFQLIEISAQSDSCSLINNLFAKADSVYELGDQKELNLSLLARIILLSEDCEDWESQTLATTKSSVIYRINKDLRKYNTYVDSALNIATKNLDSFHFLLPYLYSESVDILRQKRLYRKSISAATKGLEHSKSKKSNLSVYLYNRLADNYISLDNYSKAMEFITSSESAILTNNIDAYHVYDAYQLKAHLHQLIKDNSLAEKYFLLAEKQLLSKVETTQQNSLLELWLVISNFYLTQKNYARSLLYLKKVENSNFIQNNYVKGKLLQSQAKLLCHQDSFDYETVIKLLEESNENYKSSINANISLDVKRAKTCEFIADLYLEQNKLNLAIQNYKNALNILGMQFNKTTINPTTNKALVISIISKLRRVYLKTNSTVKAEYIESSIINLIKQLSIESTSMSLKEYWGLENQKLFEELITYNSLLRRNEKVFKLIEENKSNLLLKDLNKNIAQGFANIPKEVLAEIQELEMELVDLKIQKADAAKAEAIDSSIINQLIIETNEYQLALDKKLRDLETTYPEFYQLKYNPPALSLADIQKQLDTETLLLEYFIGTEKGYLAIVSNKELEIVELDSIENISSIALDYYQFISDKDNTNFSSDALFNGLKLNLLSQKYPNAKNLVVIPDDFLNNIPFEMLANKDNHLLIDNYNIQYQYSARLWNLLKERKSEKKKYDFLGYAYNNNNAEYVVDRSCIDVDPANLRCAEKEIGDLAKILDNKKVNGFEGSLDELLTLAKETRILHLATHACQDASDSELSKIYFTDGELTNHDLKLQDIPADLVVLSACETGYGEIIKGEGSISLSKGFFHAGASSTLVSLWPVDDCTTADLMGYFYENLKAGQSKDAALRNAKLDYQKYANPEKTHPYYWAGFVVIGDCAPIWNNTSGALASYCMLAFILGLGLFFLWSRRKSKQA